MYDANSGRPETAPNKFPTKQIIDQTGPGKKESQRLAGAGEMAERTRTLDWSATPLGAFAHWPQSLRTAVDIMLHSRYAMFVWWGKELINLYNDSYRPFLGKKHPEALGQSARTVWAEIWDLIGPRTEAVLERAESTFDDSLLLLMERFDYLEETYFTFSYSPIRDDRGNVGGLFCAVTEETGRIIGERRLRLLREVASTSSETHSPEQVCAAAAQCFPQNAHDLPFALIYLIDRDSGNARLVAQAGIEPGVPAAEALVDLESGASAWPLREAAQRNDYSIVEDLPSRFAALPTGAWDRPPARAVVVPLREHGQTGLAGFLVAGLNPYLLFEGEYRGFVGLLANQIAGGIANARAYQEERRRAEALAEIDRAKTAFFSNISHEFRTPLTLLLGPVEEALSKPPEASGLLYKDLTLIHRNGLRLLRLVNMLLDFSRIEAGRVQASYEPIDLAKFTADLASEFRAATDKAGLQLRVDRQPLGEPVWVDRSMWEKIVLNLLSNAMKFTLKGEIVVRLWRENGEAVLSVEDTGIGIPEHELPRIFDRFHRVEGAEGRTHEGSGIGLALVQELVRLHGGTIGVESAVGQGTLFRVAVPLGSSHLPANRLLYEPPVASTPHGAQPYVEEALRWVSGVGPEDNAAEAALERELLSDRSLDVGEGERPTVLLADDNADVRDYITGLLAPYYEVRTVADGAEALSAMRRECPDLLLSDVMMPRLDGFALLREIRADAALAEVPVVLLSARAGEDASVEGLQTGADDYVVKPFSARELLARVSTNLKMAKLRQGLERRIASDLQAMTILREHGSLCVRQDIEVRQCLDETLDAAIALTGADKGTVQLFDNEAQALIISAQRGFEKPMLDFFKYVRDDATDAAAAMRLGELVTVEDIMRSEIFAGQEAQKVIIAAGVRALVSMPLVSSKGEVLGMISVHFHEPHRPGERELHFLTLLARQTADYLERNRSAELQGILLRELQHRSSNLLSVIQSVAHSSLSGERSLKEARTAFEARLQALARANRQLTKSSWMGAGLREIVRMELEPFAGQVEVMGPAITLGPQQAQNFSLALHELATNAAKYGALSVKTGKVRLTWTIVNSAENRSLMFEWAESGGPPVHQPARQGFGTSLLKAVFSDIRLDYASAGFQCEISTSLKEASAAHYAGGQA